MRRFLNPYNRLIKAIASLVVIQIGFAPAVSAEDAMPASAQVTHQTVFISKGASLPIMSNSAFDMLVVAEPEVAVAAPVSTREYYVRGRSIGTTNMLVYNEAGKLVQLVDIVVTPDIGIIQRDLDLLFPNADITLHAVAEKVRVSGSVDSPETIDRILEVVEGHVPGLVIDALDTTLPGQVLLEVRFLEASREDIQELGFGSDISRPGDFLFLTSERLLSGSVGNTIGAITGGTGSTSIDVFLQALEEVGLIRTLAEPNLVSRSGQTASFLAGGEFPVPVAADEGNITIQFKNFGVGLEFTPIVESDERIILSVTPEVSGLDPRNSVRLSDVEIPAITVRRIQTQVELASGQSFAIAGLIQNDFQLSKAQTPLLGDLPILGALFRSSRFINNETELVVIITPHLVMPPRNGQTLATPIDNSENVGLVEFQALGKMEKGDGAPLGDAVRSNIASQKREPTTPEAE